MYEPIDWTKRPAIKRMLAGRLYRIRQQRRLLRKTAAAGIGITTKTLWAYETGKRLMDLGMLVRIANYYGVGIDFLLSDLFDSMNPEDSVKRYIEGQIHFR